MPEPTGPGDLTPQQCRDLLKKDREDRHKNHKHTYSGQHIIAGGRVLYFCPVCFEWRPE